MRNAWNIIIDDFRRLTSSVVVMVIMLGLCIVPCLYAWFNIFSNWDPYAETATGRIAVAVANEDEGDQLMGLPINVGEKLTDQLAGNRSIGWIFVDRKKAMEGVRAGDYYAAVIIPEDFTSDIMSFTTGDPIHPELEYYENVKKNAIAPKITGKARTTLQEQVDAAFIETIGKYMTEAASFADSTGMKPEDVYSDLEERVGLLSERMDDLVAIVTAAQGLSDAADRMLEATDSFTDSTRKALSAEEKVLDREEAALPGTEKDAKAVSASIRREATAIAGGLNQLYSALSALTGDMNAFNEFVVRDLQEREKLVSEMAVSAQQVADRLAQIGLSGLAERFYRLAQRLTGIAQTLGELEVADETTWPQIQRKLNDLLADISNTADTASSIADDADRNLDNKISKVIGETKKSIHQIQSSLTRSYDDLDTINSVLAGSEDALKRLDDGLDVSVLALMDTQKGLRELSELFGSLADSELLDDVNYLISDGTDVIAQNLASPIKMKTQTIYPIRNFGSVMASFYTVLAQGVGAIFIVALVSAKVKRREEDEAPAPGICARFFGRYRLFLSVGLAQALIVSLGDLLYVGIQCHHPILFILAACVNGAVFTMINFALVFALEKVGLALCVVVLVLQVAGAGGTFPAEVLPGPLRFLHTFMPFPYAMDAMRECVGGMYGHTYLTSLCILLAFGASAAILGLLLARPASIINRMIEKSAEKSEIIEA